LPTPVRKQYLDMKAQYPDAILLFRMGDFYETFDEDARTIARDLEIVLTQREMGQGELVPLAGVPYHALDSYLARLIRKGHRVAICEQLTEPDGRKPVERGVVRVVTPGTVLEPALLDQEANNYLAAVAVDGNAAGIAHVDITTGEFGVTELPAEQAEQELARLAPAEVLVAKGADEGSWLVAERSGYTVTPLEAQAFGARHARQRVLDHFEVTTLEPFGCERLPLATAAAGAVLEYLERTNKGVLGQLTSMHTYGVERFMALDPQTRRNLELFEGGRWGAREHSLFAVLNLTKTPMGARMLRRWLGQPLLDLAELRRRQDAVVWCFHSAARRQRLQAALASIGDIERALHRIGTGIAVPRELVALRQALQQVPVFKDLLAQAPDAPRWLDADLLPCADTVALLSAAIADEPQGAVGEGGVIRPGFSKELDDVRSIAQDARSYIAALERRERERTGISSLKVGYNKVFGYYLEVTNPHLALVPSDYVRRQTLTNAERFVTPDLKDSEDRVLNARERLEELETALYRQVCRQVADRTEQVTRTANAIAALDVLLSLAEVASRNGYVRPALDNGEVLDVQAGRHPVVETLLPPGTFVPNDTRLATADEQLIILTGPNMAGKSTYLRQVALIVLMAQIGGFVPARSARVGLVDRIFTRVGLQDDLSTGQSTFMVEMVETAAILHHATRRSLVILDEIGRGTSTYDGLSIAQAVAEHLHNVPRLGCRTLFATHYHELTTLAARLPRVRNYNVAVAEEGGRVVFLHRIVPGGADRSYGVHVAQLAGLPRTVIQRAWELLAEHESASARNGLAMGKDGKGRRRVGEAPQLSLFAAPAERAPALEALRRIDVNAMTPLEALNKLYELRKLADEHGHGFEPAQ